MTLAYPRLNFNITILQGEVEKEEFPFGHKMIL